MTRPKIKKEEKKRVSITMHPAYLEFLTYLGRGRKEVAISSMIKTHEDWDAFKRLRKAKKMHELDLKDKYETMGAKNKA